MKEFRINIFARLFNLMEGELNYSVEESQKFLDGYNFLVISNNSANYAPIDQADSKFFTTYVKTIEYIKFFLDNDFS